jgi:hypothetical protein
VVGQHSFGEVLCEDAHRSAFNESAGQGALKGAGVKNRVRRRTFRRTKEGENQTNVREIRFDAEAAGQVGFEEGDEAVSIFSNGVTMGSHQKPRLLENYRSRVARG